MVEEVTIINGKDGQSDPKEALEIHQYLITQLLRAQPFFLFFSHRPSLAKQLARFIFSQTRHIDSLKPNYYTSYAYFNSNPYNIKSGQKRTHTLVIPVHLQQIFLQVCLVGVEQWAFIEVFLKPKLLFFQPVFYVSMIIWIFSVVVFKLYSLMLPCLNILVDILLVELTSFFCPPACLEVAHHLHGLNFFVQLDLFSFPVVPIYFQLL